MHYHKFDPRCQGIDCITKGTWFSREINPNAPRRLKVAVCGRWITRDYITSE